MIRIKDIICTQKEYDELGSYEVGFSGRVLLYDDHKFEGVLANRKLMKKLFVFGVMEKDGIRMYSSSEKDVDFPKVYRAKQKGKTSYEGTMGITDRFIDLTITDCRVDVLEPDTYRDYEHELELALTKKAVDKFKPLLGEESNAIYEDVFYTRENPKLEKKAQNK